ncbi:MAG: hypothetical protein IPK82_39830 [Polyangiaceae bacterium]|nr:hypothetical protein [Polyangiaceae bacterium]
MVIRRSFRAVFFAILPIAFTVSAGSCRQVLNIEERELVATGGSGGASPFSCETYCATIISVCVGVNTQFSTEAACLNYCSTYPLGTEDDTIGNTLGCRLNVLKAGQAMIEPGECAAAGPAGNGACGSNCDSYCTSIMSICPDAFETKGDCTTFCPDILSCGDYGFDPEGTTPDNPTLQCRIYHLTVAARDGISPANPTSSQALHCPHAAGEGICVHDPAAVCPAD